MAGLAAKLAKKYANSGFWRKVKASPIISKEGEELAEGFATEQAAKRGARPSFTAPDEDAMIREVTGEMEDIPLSDAEILALRKKYNVTPETSEKPLSKSEKDRLRYMQKKGQAPTTSSAEKPSAVEIEMTVKGNPDLIKKGRELFPEFETEPDEFIESLMKNLGK